MTAEKRGRQASYPFDQLEVGEFFEFNGCDEILLRRLRQMASLSGKLQGKQFSVKSTHPIEKTYRCWRIE